MYTITKERQEILDKIMQLQIEHGERQCDSASHGLDLSDEFARAEKSHSIKLRALQAKLDEDEVNEEVCPYWEFGRRNKGKSISLELVRDI